MSRGEAFRKDAGGLSDVFISSGVSAFTGKPFCLVEAVSTSGDRWTGQLSPKEVRTMALHWLEAAEAAEHDAAVRAELVEELGLGDHAAAAFIAALRERREQ